MKTLMNWGITLNFKSYAERQNICTRLVFGIQQVYLSTKLNASSDTILQTLYGPEIAKLERLARIVRICVDGHITTMCSLLVSEGHEAQAIKLLEQWYPEIDKGAL